MNTMDRDLPLSTTTKTNVKAGQPPRALINQKLAETLLGYVFLLPSLLLFAIFLFYPLLQTFYLSFHETDPRGRVASYVGFDNFIAIFTSERFYKSLEVTGLFTLLTVPTGIALALLLAALTHNHLKGMRIFQFIFSLPVVLSVGTSAVIWIMLFHPSVGMLNYLLSIVGLEPVAWLTDPSWALFSVSMMTVWMNLGFTYIVLLSGLQGIPEEIYDSAKIDGSGPFRTFIQIIFPLLSPTVFFVTIVSIIGAFQSFGQIHILTKGGPVNSTDVLVYSLYQDAFINFRFGTGSAQALVLFTIILIFTVVQFKVFERNVHYQ
ncbi:sn-glycerol 3-phosphate transport system permease protein [Paenibacillus sp. V4I3]|uniref:carbohydrate ABC transporter permease n=1 Tax=unclassified Paenibacillus TaxID=185978 RepID=UPI002785CB0A|nr:MULTISPECIES: sugar ABC transporter permease [unclassified Paenibacillus]MDQ0877927.1 sn-glycerol 3-phosphate transport system permease protein [Paenibacillus sp. V4I3]MDQ0886249.1 sn-glycerol 3-phosphate transport system permease protein [Paenibacillus sp. V4I9]